MLRNVRSSLVALGVLVGVLPATQARAGEFWNWLTHSDCQVPSYHPARYWAPHLARCYDDHCGPRLSAYSPYHEPDGVWVAKFSKCYPAPDPAATIVPIPTPPPTSQAR